MVFVHSPGSGDEEKQIGTQSATGGVHASDRGGLNVGAGREGYSAGPQIPTVFLRNCLFHL